MAEQQRLEEQNNVLEMRLERNNLQVKPSTGANGDSISSDLNSAAIFSALQGAPD